MSYDTQAKLAQDPVFQSRVKACCTQQGYATEDELGSAILRGDPGTLNAFYNVAASSPGFSESVDVGDGTIDQSQVTDAELLSTVQASWATIAGLYG